MSLSLKSIRGLGYGLTALQRLNVINNSKIKIPTLKDILNTKNKIKTLKEANQKRLLEKNTNLSTLKVNIEEIGIPYFAAASEAIIDDTRKYTVKDKIKDLMIPIELYPFEPIFNFEKHMIKYLRPDFRQGKDNYLEIMKNLGYKVEAPSSRGRKLKMVVWAYPNSVSGGGLDVSNNIGSSVFDKYSSMAQGDLTELIQILKPSFERAGINQKDVVNFLKGMANKIPGFVRGFAKGATNEFLETLEKSVGKEKYNKIKNIVKNMGSNMNEMLPMLWGQKTTMPQVWKDSSISSSFSFSFRIGDMPKVDMKDPENMKLYESFILGQVAAILAISSPRSDNKITYYNPLYVSFKSPGIYNGKMGIITGISLSPAPISERSVYNVPEYFDVSVSISVLDQNMILVTGKKATLNEDVDDIVLNTVQDYLKIIKTPLEYRYQEAQRLKTKYGQGDLVDKLTKIANDKDLNLLQKLSRAEDVIINEARGIKSQYIDNVSTLDTWYKNNEKDIEEQQEKWLKVTNLGKYL